MYRLNIIFTVFALVTAVSSQSTSLYLIVAQPDLLCSLGNAIDPGYCHIQVGTFSNLTYEQSIYVAGTIATINANAFTKQTYTIIFSGWYGPTSDTIAVVQKTSPLNLLRYGLYQYFASLYPTAWQSSGPDAIMVLPKDGGIYLSLAGKSHQFLLMACGGPTPGYVLGGGLANPAAPACTMGDFPNAIKSATSVYDNSFWIPIVSIITLAGIIVVILYASVGVAMIRRVVGLTGTRARLTPATLEHGDEVPLTVLTGSTTSSTNLSDV